MRNKISIVLGLLFVLNSAWTMAASTCSATPQNAIQTRGRAQANIATDYLSKISSEGYRLRRVTVDPVLHRKWAWIESCSHPERPPRVIALPAADEILPPRNANVSSIDIAHAEPVRPNRVAMGDPVVSKQSSGAHSWSRDHSAIPFATVRPAFVPSSAIDPSPLGAPWVRAGDRVHLWSSDANVRLEVEVIALEYGRAGQVIHFRRKGQETLLAGIVMGKDSAELMP